MREYNYLIKKLNKNHINDAATIWKESLPLNIKSIIGSVIIKDYLEKIIESDKSLSNGIFFNEKLLGFVIFNHDEKFLMNFILKNIHIVSFSFLKNIIFFNFKNIFFFINVFLYLLFFPKKNNSSSIFETELLVIVISNNFKNRKLGTKLIQGTINNKYFNSFKKINVITLKDTPENIYFYQKNGFKINFEYFGRVFLNYFLNR